MYLLKYLYLNKIKISNTYLKLFKLHQEATWRKEKASVRNKNRGARRRFIQRETRRETLGQLGIDGNEVQLRRGVSRVSLRRNQKCLSIGGDNISMDIHPQLNGSTTKHRIFSINNLTIFLSLSSNPPFLMLCNRVTFLSLHLFLTTSLVFFPSI